MRPEVRYRGYSVARRSLVFGSTLAFALAILTCPAAAGADPTPRALLYAGFNGGHVATVGVVEVQSATFDPSGKIAEGLVIRKGLDQPESRILSYLEVLDARRGSMAFWIKLNSSTVSGPPELFSVFPGAPVIAVTFLPDRPDPNNPAVTLSGEVSFNVKLSPTVDGNYSLDEKIGTGPFSFTPGNWHHVVWTWQGMHHKVYLDGRLTTDEILVTPLPPQVLPAFRMGTFAGGSQDVTIDEFGTYNFAMSPDEVEAAFSSVLSAPILPVDSHGIDVTAEWGPGVGKVHVTVDSGNDLEAAAASYRVEAYRGAELVGHGELLGLRRGFGEGLIAVGTMVPGTYRTVVVLLDSQEAVLATTTSRDFILPDTAWIGNSLGIRDVVQPPYTPIEVNGTRLKVWGREYDLAGGFGLPSQITSQGRMLLAGAVTLEFDTGAETFQLQPSSLSITEVQPHRVRWAGTAAARGITAAVTGSLEYDGMMLLKLRLAPASAPVAIRSIRLHTVLPSTRAIFMFTTADQPYWWYPYKKAVPVAPGRFHSNLDQRPHHSRFLPVILFSDDDGGLEWFAENQAGWQVAESEPMQEMIRDENGNVRLQNNFANKPFILAQPIEIAFGYEATPVKPLPIDWRAGRMGASGGVSAFPNNDFDVYWDWRGQATGGRSTANFPPFQLVPHDTAAYIAAIEPLRSRNRKVVPFTNLHVTVPSGGDDWSDLEAIRAETRNDGWISLPTKANNDYWSYHIDRALALNVYDGIYGDEPAPLTSASLLSGAGYIKDDGTHGSGYLLLGMREQLKRLRQIMLDHGKRPVIWLHATAKMYPHVFAFADIVSDGESYMFVNPTDPDWIDLWGHEGLEWLRGLSRAQKFGLVPAFLNYIRFWGEPEYPAAMRARFGLLSIHDIIPETSDSSYTVFDGIKSDFAITAPDVVFKGYWEQTAIQPDRPDVKVSYYSRRRSALVVVTNFGEAYTGNVHFDLAGLGVDSAMVTLTDAESRQPLTLQDGFASLSIPRHDFRILQISALRAPRRSSSKSPGPERGAVGCSARPRESCVEGRARRPIRLAPW